MKTGLESLDAGAPDITYSGNEGPKSPQEDQQKMAEFQLQEYMEEFESVFPDMKDQRGTPDYMKELQDYFEGLASKQDEGIGDMAMKSGLIDEYRNYKMGQEEAGEQFMLPRDYYRSQEQDRMGVANGGVMQLVKEKEDGSRPGYRGDAAYGDRNEKGQVKDSVAAGDGPKRGSGAPDGNPSPVDVISDTPMDIKEQVRLGNPVSKIGTVMYETPDFTKVGPGSTMDDNRIKAFNLKNKPYSFTAVPSIVPYSTAFNTVGKYLGGFGYEKNKAFFAKNVAGNYGYGYGEEDFKQYMRDRGMGKVGAYGNENMGQNAINERAGGPIYYPGYTPGETPVISNTNTDTASIIPYRGDQFLRADNQALLAADGGRIGYADGGITDLRQGYFLGKLVKKATRAVKKIVKSPIGKAALAFGAYKLGGGLFGKTKFGFMKPGSKFFSGLPTGKGFTGQIFDKLLRSKDSGYTNFDPFKVGILGLSALTYFKGKQDEDDEPSLDEYMGSASRGPSIDPRGIRQMIAANKGNINPQDFAFLNPAYYQNAADGGRIGLAGGSIGKLRGALSNQQFGYDDDEDNIKKLAMGGSAGMPPVTMQTEGQNIQSFPDDESMPMAQGPQNPMPMKQPMMNPMMDPRMMQQMMMAKQQGGQNRMMAAMGGRMGYGFGKKVSAMMTPNDDSVEAGSSSGLGGMIVNMIRENPNMFKTSKMMLDRDGDGIDDRTQLNNNRFFAAMGGRMGYAEGGESELLDMGGLEKDYRNDGGFVPMGEYERKDDVPARLSKNEFVFTADAVRNAGGGDIDKGAEIMENMMNNLEQGGQVSEESQGLRGAREMFQTQQRLGEVL
jgi:hypothetical protein